MQDGSQGEVAAQAGEVAQRHGESSVTSPPGLDSIVQGTPQRAAGLDPADSIRIAVREDGGLPCCLTQLLHRGAKVLGDGGFDTDGPAVAGVAEGQHMGV